MNLIKYNKTEVCKTGRQIRSEILGALSTHDILSTQQLAISVEQTIGPVANQLLWLSQRDAIERVLHVSDEHREYSRYYFWGDFWSMTNHGRHHLKRHFADCRGCRIREMEEYAARMIILRKKAIGELHGCE